METKVAVLLCLHIIMPFSETNLSKEIRCLKELNEVFRDAIDSGARRPNITNSGLKKIRKCVDNVCGKEALCKNNENLQTPRCHCDEYCERLNDCCLDYFQQNATADDRQARPDADLGGVIHCSTTFRHTSFLDGDYQPGIQMVDTCNGDDKMATTEEKTVRNLCQNTLTSVPPKLAIPYRTPLYDKNTSLVFKNIFCAICNNITVQDPLWFDLLIITEWCVKSLEELDKYPLDYKLYLMMIKNQCPYIYLPPTGASVRPCIDPSVASEIQVETTQFLCNDYMNPVYDDRFKSLHKNVFCYILNEGFGGGGPWTYPYTPFHTQVLDNVKCGILDVEKAIFPTENLLNSPSIRMVVTLEPQIPSNISVLDDKEPTSDEGVRFSSIGTKLF